MFGKFSTVIISDLNNRFLHGMFKMVQLMRWRYCSNFYNIGDYNTIAYMDNAFMFDGRHGVKTYIKKLKGILMWSFFMLTHVRIISSNAYSGFLVALQDIG